MYVNAGISKIFEAVRDAFSACHLPPRTFKNERDLRLVLFPAMSANIIGSVTIHDEEEALDVPDFIAQETICPDGEARLNGNVVALELKLLRGRRNTDAGDLHRGLGQCLAYVSSDRYMGSILLVVIAGAIRRTTRPSAPIGSPLLVTPGPICLATKPARHVMPMCRWHDVTQDAIAT